MFLLVLLLILAADILFLKMLTYKKKDEKQYFYKVNEELEKNFVENSTYEGTVYFNSEFIPNYSMNFKIPYKHWTLRA